MIKRRSELEMDRVERKWWRGGRGALALTLGLCAAWACSPPGESSSKTDASSTEAGTDVAASKPTPAPPPPDAWSNEDLVYGLGVATARGMDRLGLTPKELEVFEQALADHRQGRERIALTQILPALADYQKSRETAAKEKEREDAAAFLEAAADEDGAKTLDSGIVVRWQAEGEEPAVEFRDAVVVRYEGRLRDGSVFDASAMRGGPQTFTMAGVIPCWSTMLLGMKTGSKATITCPASMAFGDFGSGPFIAPGAAIQYDIEVVEVKKGAAGIHGGMFPQRPNVGGGGGPIH